MSSVQHLIEKENIAVGFCRGNSILGAMTFKKKSYQECKRGSEKKKNLGSVRSDSDSSTPKRGTPIDTKTVRTSPGQCIGEQ